MSTFIELSAAAKAELEAATGSVNELVLDGVRVLAWVERWRDVPLGEDGQGDWRPVDATVSFTDGMQAGRSARMRLSMLLPDTLPDLEGHPHWVAFAQGVASLFAPVVIEIEPQSQRLILSYEQLLYAGTEPQLVLHCEKLAYLASVAVPALKRIRLEAWSMDDARNLAHQVLNEALTLGYQQ